MLHGKLGEDSVYYRIYSPIHPSKIAASIRGPGNSIYNSLIQHSPVKYNSINNWTNYNVVETSGPAGVNTYYNKTAVIFHTDEMSRYPSVSQSAKDKTKYFYSLYSLNWSNLQDMSSVTNIVNSANRKETGRPVEKSSLELNSIYKIMYPMYNDPSNSRNGMVRPYRAMIFCTSPHSNTANDSGYHKNVLSSGSASSITGANYYSSLRNEHVTVVDYKINAKGYKDIVKEFGQYAKKDGTGAQNEYYIYMSDRTVTKGGPGVWENNNVYYSDTIGAYYNAIFPANGVSKGWAYSEKGVKQTNPNEATPFSSAINSYDNKFHFTEPPTQKVVVRYYDVAGGDLELDREVLNSTVEFSKNPVSRFTQSEIDNMFLKEETITSFENDKRKFTLKIPEGYEYIGYNSNPNSKLTYTNNTIRVGHKGDKVYQGTSSNNEIFIDVFLNSKKRVYVRHLNVSEYYDRASNTIKNISYNILNNQALLLNKNPKNSKLYHNSGNYLGYMNANLNKSGYSECYSIKWDNKLEVTNIKNNDTEYVGYYRVDSYKASNALKGFKDKYNSSEINNLNKDLRIFTQTGTGSTYIDLFYIDRKDIGKCVDPNYESGKVVDVAGRLVFESTDPNFANETANELNSSQMIMDKIPSSEELKYGVLGAREYIITRANTDCVNDRIFIDNGKNVFEIQYEYNKPRLVSFFGIKDNMIMNDRDSQEGKLLFSNQNKDYSIKLNDTYLGYLNGAHLTNGNVHTNYTSDSLPCDKCNGSICKNYYVEVSIKNMELIYKGNALIPAYDATSGRLEIRKERCKKDDKGEVILDESATIYITPTVKKVMTDDYHNKVKSAITAANNAAVVTDMNYLYDGNNKAVIPGEKYNGIRVPSATFEYRLVSNASVGTPVDTVPAKTLKKAKTEVEEVCVYTPVIAKSTLESNGNFVNHTGQSVSTSNIIQKNVPFMIRPETQGVPHPAYINIKDFAKYTKEHYIKFNFDIQWVEYYHNGQNVPYTKDSKMIPAGSWIKIAKGDYIKAQAVYDPNKVENEVVNSLESEYYIKTVAINAPASENYKNEMLAANLLGDSEKNINVLTHKTYHGIDLKYEYKYMAFKKQDTSVLGRIYDFRITDLVDIDWKNVFRRDDSMTHTGRFYYSGTHRWDMLSSQSNQMVQRGTTEIGTNPQRLLPVGPFKHTNTSYLKGPKLGYRFAFDVKTTGSVSDSITKSVVITPKFYYISKDGSRYIENINLYYKNETARYIKVGSSSDKYKITMRPADGLRHLAEYEKSYNKTNMSKDMISVGNLSKIELKQGTNMATNDNAFLQIWYGEYKLPNTTIAVESSVDDINKPLTNGYIGIKFDISCVEKKNGTNITTTIHYGANDLNASGPNTTQWDYERYLGSTPGQAFNGSIRLPGGTFNINNEIYQKIRGTVALYETDERAATDFDTGASK